MKWYKLTLIFVCLNSMSALAELGIQGYATLGGGIFSEENSEYRDVDDSFSSDPFNKLGLQFKAGVNDKTDVTLQLTSKGVNDYDVSTEWFYLTYHLSKSSSVKVGRVRMPFFYYSDFLDVSFAHPWAIPPSEVYRLDTFNNIDGIDYVNRHRLGNWNGSLQSVFGRIKSKGESETESLLIDTKDWISLNYSLNKDWFTARASYSQTSFSVIGSDTLDSVVEGLRSLGAVNAADVIESKDEDAAFASLGFHIDKDNLISVLEYTSVIVDEPGTSLDDDAWYLTLAYRFGDWTPHITFANVESEIPDVSFVNEIPNLPNSSLDEQLSAAAQAIVTSTITDRSSLSIGLRYDYSSNSALKFELTQIDDKVSGVDGSLLSITVDTLF